MLSIGKPIWGVEVRVVDEQDKALPPGPENIGEIVIRGHNVMKAYYRRPQETAEACRPRDVRVTAELPKGPTGKILKRELRAG